LSEAAPLLKAAGFAGFLLGGLSAMGAFSTAEERDAVEKAQLAKDAELGVKSPIEIPGDFQPDGRPTVIPMAPTGINMSPLLPEPNASYAEPQEQPSHE
jgi:hypothetical protein